MSRKIRPLLPYAEVALVTLSLFTVAGLWRLFSGGSFFPQLACIVIVAHVASIVPRRLGWSVPATGAISLVAMVVTVGVVLYPGTTFAGIPTLSTLQAARDDVASLGDLFSSVQAPTPAVTPFLLIAALGLWWAAFVADWAAFRLWVPFEAVMPTATVFVFASLFASQHGQIVASMLYVAAALGFVLVHRVTRQQTSPGWVSTDVQRGTNALLRTGAGLAALSIFAAVVIGPNLPQAQSRALIGWRNGDNGDGPSSRTTVSPFVEIKKRLVNQANNELFTVKTDHRSYWRMTSLDKFDGNVWSSNGSYQRASGSLPQRVPNNVSTTVSQQTFAITELDTIWLPAAFEPRSISAGNTAVRYEPDSATLIVGGTLPNSNGSTYDVQSALPDFDPGKLEQAPPSPASDFLHDETQLPPDLPSRVKQLAETVTASSATPYDKALALQNYFRDNFTYDLNVDTGQSDDAIVAFLDSRRGYCEQFAGTFAAMARSIGLPTRVAVGFTPGEEDPAKPGTYHVKGLHAHAWPEVYFVGEGWVLFEPTPSRGAPNATQYTHVAEEQATAGGAATTLVPTTAAPTTTSAPSTATTAPRERDTGAGEDGSIQTTGSFWSANRFGGRALIGAGALLLLAAIYVVVVPVVYAVYRRRRRAAANAPSDRVRLAWQESVEATQTIGLAPRRSETAVEFARRAAADLGAIDLPTLAHLVAVAEYSAEGADEAQAAAATTIADRVRATVRERSSRQERMLAALDPRPPHRRGPISPRRQAGPPSVELPSIEIVRLPA